MLKFLTTIILYTAIFGLAKSQEMPYRNPNVSMDDRVADLMTRMTLEEKIAQMCQYVAPAHIERSKKRIKNKELIYNDQWGMYPGLTGEKLKQKVIDGEIGSFLHVKNATESNELQRLAKKSRLGIPLLIGIDAIHGHAMVSGTTVFPTQLGISSTWDNDLAYRIAEASAKEVRATGMHWTFSPNVEVARDPRWGRIGETFGEDPYLVGQMGLAFTRGYQGDFSKHNVLACAKHFVGGGEPYNGTNASPLDVSERQLREVWLPPFKKQVEAGVFTFMAAHNEINGIPSHMNQFILQDILRDEWGFNGFVVSDWMDIERIHRLHKVTSVQRESVRQSVNAGMDMHMHGPNFLKPLAELVQEGSVSEERIDEACRAILKAKFMLGLFDDPFVDESETETILFSKAHQKLALEAARKSLVLLKNDGILPLKNPGKILVTGPNANNHRVMGDWASGQPKENIQTIFEGFKKLYGDSNVDFVDSGESLLHPNDSLLDQAILQASGYETIVVVVGSNSLRNQRKEKTCGENVDRATINLLGNQLQLVQKLYEINKNIVVVMVNGRPLAEPWIKDNIPAIIEAWEPGAFAGQAVAEVISGKVNPSGKLTVTFPYHSGQIPMVYNHKPSSFFRKYIDSPSEPMWHFGHGLSYSSFSYRNAKIQASENGFTVAVEVKNTSEVDGTEIVQLYIRDKRSSVTRPVKELKNYKRVTLAAGKTKNIELNISMQDISFYDLEMNWKVEAGDFIALVGSSSKDEDLIKLNFNLDNRIHDEKQ